MNQIHGLHLYLAFLHFYISTSVSHSPIHSSGAWTDYDDRRPWAQNQNGLPPPASPNHTRTCNSSLHVHYRKERTVLYSASQGNTHSNRVQLCKQTNTLNVVDYHFEKVWKQISYLQFIKVDNEYNSHSRGATCPLGNRLHNMSLLNEQTRDHLFQSLADAGYLAPLLWNEEAPLSMRIVFTLSLDILPHIAGSTTVSHQESSSAPLWYRPVVWLKKL